jgi:hypothetical protein
MKFKEMQKGTSTNVTTVVAFSTAAFFMPIALCIHGMIIRNIKRGNGGIRMTALHCIPESTILERKNVIWFWQSLYKGMLPYHFILSCLSL